MPLFGFQIADKASNKFDCGPEAFTDRVIGRGKVLMTNGMGFFICQETEGKLSSLLCKLRLFWKEHIVVYVG